MGKWSWPKMGLRTCSCICGVPDLPFTVTSFAPSTPLHHTCLGRAGAPLACGVTHRKPPQKGGAEHNGTAVLFCLTFYLGLALKIWANMPHGVSYIYPPRPMPLPACLPPILHLPSFMPPCSTTPVRWLVSISLFVSGQHGHGMESAADTLVPRAVWSPDISMVLSAMSIQAHAC